MSFAVNYSFIFIFYKKIFRSWHMLYYKQTAMPIFCFLDGNLLASATAKFSQARGHFSSLFYFIAFLLFFDLMAINFGIMWQITAAASAANANSIYRFNARLPSKHMAVCCDSVVHRLNFISKLKVTAFDFPNYAFE